MITAVPAVGGRKPVIMRIVVVFPRRLGLNTQHFSLFGLKRDCRERLSTGRMIFEDYLLPAISFFLLFRFKIFNHEYLFSCPNENIFKI